jgi:hypothetical protein
VIEARCGERVFMAGTEADHDISTLVPPAHATKKRGGKGSRIDMTREQIVDIEHALAELAAARDEMSQVPEGLNRHQREAAMIEPMARVSLVVKFCEDVLRRNGWKREAVK